MPVQTNYPGVYIEERPSGVHTIVGVSTSVTAFVGAAATGPVDSPQRVFSFSDYVRLFGPPVDDSQPMGHAVQHFFANGGSQAIVVRVLGAGAAAAATTLKETLPGGTDVLTLAAKGKGKWANWNGSVGVYVAADPETSTPPHARPSDRSLVMSPEGAGVTVTAESRPALSDVIVSLPPACDAVAARPAFERALLSSAAICAGVLETSVVSLAKRTMSTAGPESTETRSVFAPALIVSGFATAAAPTDVPLTADASAPGRLGTTSCDAARTLSA